MARWKPCAVSARWAALYALVISQVAQIPSLSRPRRGPRATRSVIDEPARPLGFLDYVCWGWGGFHARNLEGMFFWRLWVSVGDAGWRLEMRVGVGDRSCTKGTTPFPGRQGRLSALSVDVAFSKNLFYCAWKMSIMRGYGYFHRIVEDGRLVSQT